MNAERITRDADADILFLRVTSDAVEVCDLSWFRDYWSREASYSRWRQRESGSLYLLEKGSQYPALFTVNNGKRLGYFTIVDGRRFARCASEIVAAADPDEVPLRHPFQYWEHDPTEGEPPVEDVEALAFPAD
ncbi:hypothetical protein [Streptomyces sp. 5-10]|uniref:hypothetical protein n=1 Tax=Streptomyces sp. 5-10 TaxID=878925 RepID=UPI00168A5276|nr:hypothetical protein [Streptomyces sp. 5-10]MBD3004627.1 hypothetical protein [Streptomyces sp. 5-10]